MLVQRGAWCGLWRSGVAALVQLTESEGREWCYAQLSRFSHQLLFWQPQWLPVRHQHSASIRQLQSERASTMVSAFAVMRARDCSGPGGFATFGRWSAGAVIFSTGAIASAAVSILPFGPAMAALRVSGLSGGVTDVTAVALWPERAQRRQCKFTAFPSDSVIRD